MDALPNRDMQQVDSGLIRSGEKPFKERYEETRGAFCSEFVRSTD